MMALFVHCGVTVRTLSRAALSYGRQLFVIESYLLFFCIDFFRLLFNTLLGTSLVNKNIKLILLHDSLWSFHLSRLNQLIDSPRIIQISCRYSVQSYLPAGEGTGEPVESRPATCGPPETARLPRHHPGHRGSD